MAIPQCTDLLITCFHQLSIPRWRIYGLQDKIQFNVRLSGATPSLLEFVSSSETSPRRKSRGSRTPSPVPRFSAVSVTLLRQISVDVNGKKSWCDTTLVEGRIWPSSATLDPEKECIDWSGEVQCGKDITVGGFDAGGVSVKVGTSLSIYQKQLLTVHLVGLRGRFTVSCGPGEVGVPTVPGCRGDSVHYRPARAQ